MPAVPQSAPSAAVASDGPQQRYGSALSLLASLFFMPAAFSIGAFAVMIITTFAHGPVAMWSLIAVGFFHSIMFPTIFTLGVKGLGPLTEEGSGLLIMAIAGGALVIVQGWLADTFDLQWSFLLTAACEIYVLFYALWESKATNALPDQHVE